MSCTGSMKPPGPSSIASARPVTTPVPRPQVPRTCSPTRAGPLQFSSSHCATSPGPRTRACTSNPWSASGSTADSVWYSRSRSTRNCKVSNSWWTASRSHCPSCRSRGPTSIATSRESSVRARLRTTSARCSRNAAPAFPETSSTRSTRESSEPNCWIHLAAVFSPTPGMDGRLSLGSPRIAAKSGYCCGDKPYRACTSCGVNRVMSLMPRRVMSTVTWSPTSWRASRSPVTTRTSIPSSTASVARVAMTSSAS